MTGTAWDPRSPSSLMVVEGNMTSLSLSKIFSSDGIGANEIETSTLLQILSSPSNYRKVLSNCLQQWEESMMSDASIESLELLKLLYAVTHVTETLVLNRAATMADVIPYLRLHHMTQVPDIDLTKSHPEESPVYWSTLQTLALRGCTSTMWALVSHHSACLRAIEKDEGGDAYQTAQREQDQAGFRALRAILESAPLPGGRDEYNDDGIMDEEEEQEDTQQLLPHVGRLDYKLWSTNPRAAHASHTAWQTAIRSSGDLQLLLRREPRLQPLLETLVGDPSALASATSWPEALCAELLYQRPNLKLVDLPTRMKKRMEGAEGPYEKILLNILEGNHGHIVEVLHHQLGGGSGAALPSTMTCLVCNHLMDAKLLPESAKDLQLELLLAASDAILSSHDKDFSVGMRLNALLLVPHCTKDNVRIVATLAESLARFSPQTDAAAHVVLDLVKPSVTERKSTRILDGCVSMVVGRYRQAEPHKAMEWLLVGKALEDDMVGDEGTCVRLISDVCRNTSFGLLHLLLLNDDEKPSVSMQDAQDMVQVLDQKLSELESVRLLVNMTKLAVAIVEQADDCSTVVATCIATCLTGGLAPPSMQWDLLKLAKKFLLEEQDRFSSGNAANFASAFTMEGTKALMERYTHLTTANEQYTVDTELELALAKGLARSIVTENAKRKERPRTAPHNAFDLRSSRVESYSAVDQQRLVARMLDL